MEVMVCAAAAAAEQEESQRKPTPVISHYTC